jgi:hypothetical protein
MMRAVRLPVDGDLGGPSSLYTPCDTKFSYGTSSKVGLGRLKADGGRRMELSSWVEVGAEWLIALRPVVMLKKIFFNKFQSLYQRSKVDTEKQYCCMKQ